MNWKTLAQASDRFGSTEQGRRHYSKRFLRNEVKDGRLRGVQIGGRGEYLTCDEWIDEWVIAQATPVPVPLKRRAYFGRDKRTADEAVR